MKQLARGTLVALCCSACATFPKDRDYVPCDLNPSPIQQSPTTMVEPPLDYMAALSKDMAECEEAKKTFSVISLSGGGPDGAFGAGFIVGRLVDQHEELHPCLVNGVSTGAVMGTYVYLATSADPARRKYGIEKLSTLYQDFDDKTLVSKHWKVGLVFSSSLYEVDGIRTMLKERITEEVLGKVLSEYEATHRRLAIGATDMATGMFDIIDLTQYIARNKSNLGNPSVQLCYQEAIRASAAIPIAFPPVPIIEQVENKAAEPKVYVDGGARHMMFINAAQLKRLAGGRKLRMYGVVNNTFVLSGMKREVTLLEAAGQNLKIATDQLYMDSAYSVDSAAADLATGNDAEGSVERFWAAMLGNESAAKCTERLGDNLFKPAYQQCLYDVGLKASKEQISVGRTGWRKNPWPVYIFQ